MKRGRVGAALAAAGAGALLLAPGKAGALDDGGPYDTEYRDRFNYSFTHESGARITCDVEVGLRTKEAWAQAWSAIYGTDSRCFGDLGIVLVHDDGRSSVGTHGNTVDVVVDPAVDPRSTHRFFFSQCRNAGSSPECELTRTLPK